MKRILRFVIALCGLALLIVPTGVLASGGSGGGGGGGGSVDTIKVSKCMYVASNGTMLVNASSANTSAHLYLYRPFGAYVGEVQNGSGGKYGGSVFYVGADPGSVTIISSGGGSITVATVPYQP